MKFKFITFTHYEENDKDDTTLRMSRLEIITANSALITSALACTLVPDFIWLYDMIKSAQKSS